jgi:hypothetical protein
MDFIFREYAQYIAAQVWDWTSYLNAVGMDFTTFARARGPQPKSRSGPSCFRSAVATRKNRAERKRKSAAEYARISDAVRDRA